jgi:putative DNA primase/helicase
MLAPNRNAAPDGHLEAAQSTKNTDDITTQFTAAIQAAGLVPPADIIPDGSLHRFSPTGRKGDDAGWYVLHTDGISAGAFGDWRTGVQSTWRADQGRRLTPAEEAEYRRRIEDAKAKAEAERQERARRAAAVAAAIWKAAKPAPANHPYLVRKGVAPVAALRALPVTEIVRRAGYAPQARGESLEGLLLIAPVKVQGMPFPATLELIDEQGRKSALAGGCKKAGYWATAPLPLSGRVVLCEGVATALSIAQALDAPVAAALSVGNLLAAGEAIKADQPGVQIVIAADLGDEGRPHPEAVKAAEALRCPLVAPPADLGKGADFNDLHMAQGLEEVRHYFTQPDVVLTAASDLRLEPVRWLWEGWLPHGKLTLLAGAPGSGKTTLAMQFAAVVSAGGVWPDGTRCDAGDVVVWSAEDSPADTLAPRLLAAGSDLSRVCFVEAVRGADGDHRPFDPAIDMPRLKAALARTKPALLILDPVVSAVAGDSHKNAEVRRSLAPVVELAESVGCCVLGITHTSKGTAGREPWERVTGSLAFAALARVVLFAAVNHNKEQADLSPRLLVCAKSNLAPVDGGFGYDIAPVEPLPGIKAPRIVWQNAIEGEARRLLATAERWEDDAEGGEMESAKRFLADLLADGPLPSKQIRADADEAGYSWRTVHRAADALGVEKVKNGFGKGAWVWQLHSCHSRHIGANLSNMARMDVLGKNGKNGGDAVGEDAV